MVSILIGVVLAVSPGEVSTFEALALKSYPGIRRSIPLETWKRELVHSGRPSKATLQRASLAILGCSISGADGEEEIRVDPSRASEAKELEATRRGKLWSDIREAVREKVQVQDNADRWVLWLRNIIERSDGSPESLRNVTKNVPLNSVVDDFVLNQSAPVERLLSVGASTWVVLSEGSSPISKSALTRLKELARCLISEPEVSDNLPPAAQHAWQSLLDNAREGRMPDTVFVSVCERLDAVEVYAAFFAADGKLLDRTRIEYRPRYASESEVDTLPSYLEPLGGVEKIEPRLLTWLNLVPGHQGKALTLADRSGLLSDDPRVLLMRALFKRRDGTTQPYVALPGDALLRIASNCLRAGELDRDMFWRKALANVEIERTPDGCILLSPRNKNLESIASPKLSQIPSLANAWRDVLPWGGLMLGQFLHDSNPAILDSETARALGHAIQSGRGQLYFHELEAYPLAYAALRAPGSYGPGSNPALWARRLALSVGFHRNGDDTSYGRDNVNGALADLAARGACRISATVEQLPFLRLDPTKPHSRFAGGSQKEFPLAFWQSYEKSAKDQGDVMEGHFFSGSAPKYRLVVAAQGGRQIEVELVDSVSYSKTSVRFPADSGVAAERTLSRSP